MTTPAPKRTWLQRFKKSRGVGKFRRNRLAMISLCIIGLYAALALWIGSMEVLYWAGKKTKAFDLQKTPILGGLLPVRAAERVGPPLLSGFGMRQSPEKRANQYNQLLEIFDQGMRSVERLTPESERTPRDVFNEQAMAERQVADVPLEQLVAARKEASEVFAEYDQFSRRVIAAQKVRIKARDILRKLAALEKAEATGEEQLGKTAEELKTELGYELEEFSFILEDERNVEEGQTFFEQIDPAAMFEAAMVIGDGEPIPEDLASRLEPVAELARDGVASLEPQMQATLDKVGAAVLKIYPMPDGFAGLTYRLRLSLGTDRQGRSILIRALYSAKIALQVGAVAAIISVIVGTFVGAAAAYFGKWVDHMVIWIYSTFSSIPYLVLLTLLAFVFQASDWVVPWDKETKISSTLIPLYAAFCMTFWIGPCRVIRGEVMKLKQLEYVQAATALGFGRFYILRKHLVPNTMHLVFINVSLLLIAAIKSEVVLTFLGLGLKDGASWGIMISQSKPDVVDGFFWQIGAATFFMLVLVLTFNIVSDALQDAFDPKHVG